MGSDYESPIQIENETSFDNLQSDEGSGEDFLKNQTELTSQKDTIYYKGSYRVTLTDSNSSNAIANKTVNFVINNVNYNATTDSNGVASVNLKLNPGNYNVFASFLGDDFFKSCNLSSTVKILPTIKANDATKYYKGGSYAVQFFTSAGDALANAKVSVTVNGKSYGKKTDSKGIVKLPADLKPGSYKIISVDPITGYKLTTTLKILLTISAADLKKVESDYRKFSAKFLKSNGKPLANKYIKFKLKGKFYKVKTNSKGKATLSLKKLKKGTYKIICYNNGLSKTYTVKVFKRKASTKLTATSYLFFSGEKKVIKVKFATALADYSCYKKTIKIKLNGKTYSRKTDWNGFAYFKVPSLKNGVYVVEYKYPGNKFYKPSKTTKLLTLASNSKTKIKVKGTKAFGYGAGTRLKVIYTVGGVPLVKKDVTLKLEGKTYVRTTDMKGIVSIPINEKIGNYTVDYKTSDGRKYNGTSGSFDINVFKRSPSKVIWKCGKSFKDNVQYFKVLVTDLKGKHASGGNIILTIDSGVYSAVVSSKGYAKFKTSVPIGKYKVSVKFKGNNYFLSSQGSKSINVKLSKFGNGLNEKNAVAYLKAYLHSSSHCKVGNSKIKSLVKSLTKGLTNDVDRAKAIFNYVRDTLEYDYYYNTWHGAVGTLKLKSGNCVDHAHLLVAMYRTAGLNARYVHGICHFKISGTTGHVWVQVKVGKNWVCADPTSYSNDLGRIKNWNTRHYHIHAKYASLPF